MLNSKEGNVISYLCLNSPKTVEENNEVSDVFLKAYSYEAF